MLAAGGGTDWLDYGEALSLGGRRGIVADLAAGQVRDPLGQIDQVSGIEGLGGTARDDVMRGDSGDNSFDGRQGLDRSTGVTGTTGWASGQSPAWAAMACISTRRCRGRRCWTTGSAMPRQWSRSRPSRCRRWMTGSGGDYDDDVSADQGADSLEGGAGDDVLRGDGGADTIEGGLGRDWIEGGAGQDVLTGGEGADSWCSAAGVPRMPMWCRTSSRARTGCGWPRAGAVCLRRGSTRGISWRATVSMPR
ncbi:MAG: hypothetical protein HZT43_07445 [Exiguobacterium profundum]|nr:MAG: hypothetical protein HZT43_07445 [Exiguobacterium profundum]